MCTWFAKSAAPNLSVVTLPLIACLIVIYLSTSKHLSVRTCYNIGMQSRTESNTQRPMVSSIHTTYTTHSHLIWPSRPHGRRNPTFRRATKCDVWSWLVRVAVSSSSVVPPLNSHIVAICGAATAVHVPVSPWCVCCVYVHSTHDVI